MIDDAINDVADTALDIHGIKWRLDNTDIDDALWHFRFAYKSHHRDCSEASWILFA